MPRQIVAKAEFNRAYYQLSEGDQKRVEEALLRSQDYLRTGQAPIGLGLKHLGRRTFEFRVGLSLRIVYVAEGDQIVLALLGNHDQVRRFLKRQ